MAKTLSVCTLVLLAVGSAAVQPAAPKPVKAPLRDLPWSNQINFLQTTDTHGWHAGHLQEASYSADWGDYISFAHHLRKKADDEGSDLLLVDSGDKVEGNGLYDSSEPKGNYTYEIFKEQDIDVIVCGNHELYKQNTSEAEYELIVPHYKENYIASNIDIIEPKTGERVPLAQRFRKFKTKNQGIQIMAFGFMFDFKRSSDHAFVQPVEDAVNEKWFQDAISDRSIDLFIVAGHAEVRSKEFSLIFDKIREQQWDVPIMFFGGHFHIRDYKKYDKKAYGLASGRYMETIGFQSISGLAIGDKDADSRALASPTFSRRYIDNNLYSLAYHSGKDEKSFHTSRGKNVTAMITSARHSLGLDQIFGCAPRDLWTNRAPYPEGDGSNSSVFTWLQKEVLPEMVQDKGRNQSRIILANTGTIRFDIFKGQFTKDTTFIIQPFTNGFRYIPDVEFDKADKLLTVLNKAGQILSVSNNGKLIDNSMLLSPEQRAMRAVRHSSSKVVLEQQSQSGLSPAHEMHGKLQYPLLRKIEKAASQATGYNDHEGDDSSDEPEPKIFPGYTTVDDAGDDGDDTEHSAIEFFRTPNVFEARVKAQSSSNDTGDDGGKVDVVFLDFVQPWILSGLKFLGAEYTANDTKPYAAELDFTTMISTWISHHWNDTTC